MANRRAKLRAFKCKNNIHRYHHCFGEAPWHKFCIDCRRRYRDFTIKAAFHAQLYGAYIYRPSLRKR